MPINQSLRALGLDDLYLLKLLHEGHTLTSAAKTLNLTQPAASQRVKKIEASFEAKLLQKVGRNVKLTQEGMNICHKAVHALSLLEENLDEKANQVINIGTRPEAGRSWLWPALKTLRKKLDHLTFHIHFSSGSDILKQLGAGELDVVLTSAPLTTAQFRSIDVAKEDYIFVAKPEIAKSIKKFSDLSHHVLVEHDRGFPFLKYISAKDRARLSFYDVWFVGSSSLMVSAIESGAGVGIVPEYLTRSLIKSKKLQEIKLPMKIDHDYFRLVYRLDRDIDQAVRELGQELIKLGLR